MKPPSEALLVFSDVHLGSDLNDTGPSVPRSATIDRDLANLIAHYRGVPPEADRWRIVIAGDFIDFVGISAHPKEDETLETELTPEENRNGVGSACDHARLKLRRVAKRHAPVFDALADFVADGHALTVLHGNHDIELHWDAVKDDFRALVAGAAEGAEREARAGRIEFSPWFFYREGVVFIEHGHQYDPFCSTRFVLSPLSPRDPRRVERGASETMLRSIVRRTPGLKEHGHEDRGLASYIGWGLTRGCRGASPSVAASSKPWASSSASRAVIPANTRAPSRASTIGASPRSPARSASRTSGCAAFLPCSRVPSPPPCTARSRV
jgi:hypothetical protein